MITHACQRYLISYNLVNMISFNYWHGEGTLDAPTQIKSSLGKSDIYNLVLVILITPCKLPGGDSFSNLLHSRHVWACLSVNHPPGTCGNPPGVHATFQIWIPWRLNFEKIVETNTPRTAWESSSGISFGYGIFASWIFNSARPCFNCLHKSSIRAFTDRFWSPIFSKSELNS